MTHQYEGRDSHSLEQSLALDSIETLRVLDVLWFDRMWKTGIAFSYRETKDNFS